MKLNLSILFFAISFSTFAQSDSIPSFKNREFGLDASAINNFLPQDLRLGLNRTTFFTFRKYKSPKKFTQHNLSFNLSGNFFDGLEDTNSGIFNFDITYRVGWGKRGNLYKKFDWIYGNDLTISPAISTMRSARRVPLNGGTTLAVEKNQSFGLVAGFGWFLGFQYQFNERFGLYTQSSLRFLAGVRNDRFIPEEFRGNSTSTFLWTLNRSFSLPSSLTFFYRF